MSFKILPQYGVVSLPFNGSRVPLLGDVQVGSPRLFRPSSFDVFFKSHADDLQNSPLFLNNRQFVETLDEHNREVWERQKKFEMGMAAEPDFSMEESIKFRSLVPLIGSTSDWYDEWNPERYPALTHIRYDSHSRQSEDTLKVSVDRERQSAALRLKQNNLEIGLMSSNRQIHTTGYILRTTDSGLRDFITASLKYYACVDAGLLRPELIPLLAANLIHHQQFVAPDVVGQEFFAFSPVAQAQIFGADFEKYFQQGFMERVFVPPVNANAKPDVEIRRLMDKSLEIVIRRPSDFKRDFMPLRHNVLMLGAGLMGNSDESRVFIDLMARNVSAA